MASRSLNGPFVLHAALTIHRVGCLDEFARSKYAPAARRRTQMSSCGRADVERGSLQALHLAFGRWFVLPALQARTGPLIRPTGAG